ncbi:MAG: redoxin domain-containing protein [Fimbriimonadaceae bacterium]
MIATLVGLLIANQQASLLPQKSLMLKVKDSAGTMQQIPQPERKATLLFIVAVDCPIANRLAPEIARIIKEYDKQSVQSLLVYPDFSRKSSEVAKHLKEFGLGAPGVIDVKHALVKATGATVTPQAVIINAKGKVVYLGRINDLFEEHGKTNPKPKSADLRDALDQFLAGKPIKNPVTQAVGCYINP